MTTDIDAPHTCPLAIDTPYGRMWHMAGSLLEEALAKSISNAGEL